MTKYIKEGVIVASPMVYKDYNGTGKVLPTIKIKDAMESYCRLGKYLKELYPMPTIGITGSVGKTTTTMFAEYVFAEKYKVYTTGGVNGKNRNTPNSIVRRMAKTYSSKYNFHIQEIGGGSKCLVENATEMLNLDAFAITNINKFHHIDNYGSTEEIIKDKTSFDRCSKKGAFGIINLDDPILRDYPFKSKIYSVGIENEKADYIGKNIIQNGKYLEFDIDDHNKMVHIRISIVGKHNVYNALMVYVFATNFGLTDEEIQRGFEKYKSYGIRQAIYDISGRIVFLDSFNTCEISVKYDCEALNEWKSIPGSKKIAILNGEGSLAENSYKINYKMGKDVAKYSGIDEFIFIGPDATEGEICNSFGNGKAAYEGAISVNKKAKILFTSNFDELTEIIKEDSKPGDILLYKGNSHFPSFCSLDKAFGTQFLFDCSVQEYIELKDKIFKIGYKKEIDSANLLKCKKTVKKIVLPSKVEDKIVSNVDAKLFFKNAKLKTIEFNSNIKGIGEKTFFKCENLSKIEGDFAVYRIGEKAFYGCSKLEEVTALELQHIETEGFKNCKSLRKLELSDACCYIAENTFDGCINLKIIAPKNSYAFNYAKEHNLL
ncbi:MAG: Mur ligase family protein [Bacilli bacterium]|nr:Mur ligase family protein [Bacilli bacterium]